MKKFLSIIGGLLAALIIWFAFSLVTVTKDHEDPDEQMKQSVYAAEK